jgi:amino acid transporter
VRPAAAHWVKRPPQVPLRPERWLVFEHGGLAPAAVADGSAALGSGSGSWGEVRDVEWGLMISWMLWVNSGYIGLGCLAAGVEDPKRTYPRIIGTLIPFVLLVIITPYMLSLSMDDATNHYDAGYCPGRPGRFPI